MIPSEDHPSHRPGDSMRDCGARERGTPPEAPGRRCVSWRHCSTWQGRRRRNRHDSNPGEKEE